MPRVFFNLDKNRIYTTYSPDEYDRSVIDHVLYRKSYQRISDNELYAIYVNLDLYKLYEMVVHKNSISNNKYHVKNIKLI